MNKLTTRNKVVAVVPFNEHDSWKVLNKILGMKIPTRDEYRTTRLKARGHFWKTGVNDTSAGYMAVNRRGRTYHTYYDINDKESEINARKAARKWALGSR